MQISKAGKSAIQKINEQKKNDLEKFQKMEKDLKKKEDDLIKKKKVLIIGYFVNNCNHKNHTNHRIRIRKKC